MDKETQRELTWAELHALNHLDGSAQGEAPDMVSIQDDKRRYVEEQQRENEKAKEKPKNGESKS